MKTLIAGSRTIEDKGLLLHSVGTALRFLSPITTVIHGGARGVDSWASEYAERHNHPPLPVTVYEADWERFGKRAGYLRNVEMAKACDQAIVIWDGASLGTKHMLDLLMTSRKPLVLVSMPSTPTPGAE